MFAQPFARLAITILLSFSALARPTESLADEKQSAPLYDDPALLIVIAPHYQHMKLEDVQGVVAPALAYAETFARGRYQVRLVVGVDDRSVQPSKAKEIVTKVARINAKLDAENQSRRPDWTKMHSIECEGYEFTTADEGQEQIRKWMFDKFLKGRRAASGRLAFRGHGEWRLGKIVAPGRPIDHGAFMLAPDDQPGSGGISLNWLMSEAFYRRIVAHIDWDMCRSTAFVEAPTPRRPDGAVVGGLLQPVGLGAMQADPLILSAARLRLNKAPIITTVSSPSNIFFTARAGRQIENDANSSLLRVISDGLKEQPGGAGNRSLVLKSAQTLRATELREEANSQEILAYAFTQVAERTDYQTSVEPKAGPIDRRRVVYSLRKDYVYDLLESNLLEGAIPQGPHSVNVVHDHGEYVFSRKKDGDSTKNMYAYLILNPMTPSESGFPLTAKRRWMELTVRATGASKITVCAQVQKSATEFVTPDRVKQHTIPGDGTPYLIAIALDPSSISTEGNRGGVDQYTSMEHVKFLGISSVLPSAALNKVKNDAKLNESWPEAGRLHLLDCRILDQNPKYTTPKKVQLPRSWPLVETENVDLVKYWWCDSVLRESDEFKVERPSHKSEGREVRVNLISPPAPASFGWGVEGPIIPPVAVDVRHSLNVIVTRGVPSQAGVNPRVGIIIYSDDAVIGRGEATLADDQTVVPCDVAAAGAIRAMSVIVLGTNRITVSSAKVVAKPPEGRATAK